MVCSTAVVVLAAGVAHAWVTIETVPVGNPGNTGEWSGESYGGYGPDRICGAVGYAYNIGKYEVTAGQYCEFLNKVAATDTYGLYSTGMRSSDFGCKIQQDNSTGSYTYSVASDWANRPVNYVSYGDAMRFANWLHNGQPTGPQNLATTENGVYYLNGATSDAALLAVTREADWRWAIPSEDEWYKAAYHDKTAGQAATYFDYPTKSNTAPGRDMADVSGNNANIYGSPYPMDSGKYTTLAGEFQNSDSPYGTFDQGGNVWERNEAVIGSWRGLRGGSYYSLSDYLLASSRTIGDPPFEYGSVGFRVVGVPEPSALALLGVGAIGLLACRWRRKRKA